MIHQIRKMVGMVVAIVAGYTAESTLEEAFGEPRVHVPRIPGLGLFLENLYFDNYNKQHGQGREVLDRGTFPLLVIYVTCAGSLSGDGRPNQPMMQLYPCCQG